MTTIGNEKEHHTFSEPLDGSLTDASGGTDLYPLVFSPAFKSYLWGGRGLEKLGKRIPDGIVAESWEISAHPDGLSHVAEGPLTGKALPDLIDMYGTALLGSDIPSAALTTFPLLVKLIDANDRLSVQVHPNDAYAAVHENGGLGKTEMWVVLEAEPGATIIHGLQPGVTREQFAQAARSGQMASLLREVPARQGDVFDIPAGLVHAVGAGLLIAEIQQSSNTTYRVYDYDRTDAEGNRRELHLQKALEVIRFEQQPEPGVVSQPVQDEQGTLRTRLVSNPYFEVDRLVISDAFAAVADGSRFYLLMGLEGTATLSWEQGQTCLERGTTCLIPAQLGPYQISGTCTLLRAWVPTR